MNQLVLWLAQGCYIGRIPFAPGTFGSLLGVAWFAALVATGRAWFYGVGCLLGIACSVWLSGKAEDILGEKDPGSVVLDEIVAIPVCFAGWLCFAAGPHGSLPPLGYFFSAPTWGATAAIFVTFRLFDIAKPWPVRQSQALRAGWGVTIDDLLAACYVNVAVFAVWTIRGCARG
jgi:phosphatidylglycerophosphatase A